MSVDPIHDLLDIDPGKLIKIPEQQHPEHDHDNDQGDRYPYHERLLFSDKKKHRQIEGNDKKNEAHERDRKAEDHI